MVPRERHMVLGHDRVGDIGERDAQMPRREVHPDDQSERVCEGDVLGPAARADALRRVQEPGRRELLDDVRDGRGGEAGRARQLHLGEAAVLLDGVDDAGSVGFTK